MLNLTKLNRLERRARFFASRPPADYYAYGRWRLTHWLRKTAPRTIEVDTFALLDALDLDKLNAASGQPTRMTRSVAAHFKTRTRPSFFFDANDWGKLLALISDADKATTIQEADAICNRIFNFRQTQIKFDGAMDWQRTPHGNVDWRWDLNRHTSFVTLGRAYWYTDDDKYARQYRALLCDWLEQNPARTDHPNWTSVFEVACRVSSWIWSFYLFRNAPAMDEEMCLLFLRGLLVHACYLDANIELHVPNNHLLLEAKALACLGILFPEFRESARWQRRGTQLLCAQLNKQVCSDGVHGEYATLYHQIVAGELLEWLVLLENNDMPAPPRMRSTFNRMSDFELALTKPDGTLPLFGDSALQDTYLRFSAARAGCIFLKQGGAAAIVPDQATCWLLGPHRVAAEQHAPESHDLTSRAFPDGGYYVMRSGNDADELYLAFDCGPFGMKAMPNHGHADALNLELFAYGQTLLVDPGFYGTSFGETWRNYFRGTRAHNTVVVDELDQSELIDVRRVYRPARATLLDWVSSAEFDFVDGAHNGYERLAEPITHRRQILFIKPFYWIIVDTLTGRGLHTFDLYFHLMPGAVVELDTLSKSLQCKHENGGGLTIVPYAAEGLHAQLFTGEINPIQGWVSLLAGEKRAAPVLRYRRRATAPVQFCTLLVPQRAGKTSSIAITPLAVETPAPETGTSMLALEIETEGYVDYFLADPVKQVTRKRVMQYETDARFFIARHGNRAQAPRQVFRRGGTVAEFNGHPLHAQPG